MVEYLVTWRIDIEADTPLEAAEKALEIHRNHDSIATVFDVQEKLGPSGPLGEGVKIDLNPEFSVETATFDTEEAAFEDMVKQLGYSLCDWRQISDAHEPVKEYQAGGYVTEVFEDKGKFSWSVISEVHEL